MTTVYTGFAPLTHKSQVCWKYSPAIVANDEQLIIMNNHKCYSATTDVTVHMGMPPGSVAYATVWWCPSRSMSYSRNMVQSSAMISDKVVSISISIPACDDVTHTSDAQHGAICLGFRAVATESKTPPSVSVSIVASLTSCVGRAPMPGMYRMTESAGLCAAQMDIKNWET